MTDVDYILEILEEDHVFGSIPDGSVVLVETTEQLVSHLAPILIRQLGVTPYILLLLTDKGFVDVARDYKINHINPQRLVVLDCVSKIEGKPIQQDAYHVPFAGTTDLEAIFSQIFSRVNSLEGRGFLCIDTLNELISSNSEMNMAKVLHLVLTKLRARKVGCLMVSVKDSLVDIVRAEIVQLFDKVIHV
jgi:hypothetical protein